MSDKMQVKPVPAAKGLADDLSPEANVHKIREIIFGGQMREYDRRFDELSSRLDSDTKRVKHELEERLDKFETFIQKEFEQINAKVQKERAERTETLDKTQQSLSTSERALTDKISRLDEQFTQEASDIRKHILAQVTDLLNRTGQLNEQLQAALKHEAQRLHQAKVGRSDLSELLTEVAMRLNDKFDLPLGLPKA